MADKNLHGTCILPRKILKESSMRVTIDHILEFDKHRKSMGLSRKYILDFLQISESTWYRWMSQKTEPTQKTLQKFEQLIQLQDATPRLSRTCRK